MTSRVLLVMNVQVGLVAELPPVTAATVRKNVALVLEQARRAEHSPRIIHIRNAGDPGEPDEEGTPTWELLHAPIPGELLIDKRKSNAFAGTNLAELVAPDAELVVVGLMSEYSIKSTCRAALLRGNTVLLMQSAHGTCNHVELVEGGRVTTADKISARVEEELDKAGAIILEMKYLPGLFDGR
ncbi:Isochorismatase-like protein [Mycena epipterygia]|nr:Isochorismatase-like protein [Mycena epipterygia]